MKKRQNISTPENAPPDKSNMGRHYWQPPLLFSIPRPYEDDFERNKEHYIIMQLLQKEIQKARDWLQQYSLQKSITKERVQNSMAIINDRFCNKAEARVNVCTETKEYINA